MGRLKGVKDLLEDAVHHGTTAVEKVHRDVASRPFDVLEAVPGIATPARGVRIVHNAITATVYASIRVINRLVGAVADEVIEVVQQRSEEREGGEE